ncbi:MAG: hypothetical protein ACT4N4_04710 [Rhodospirillales bacterium]
MALAAILKQLRAAAPALALAALLGGCLGFGGGGGEDEPPPPKTSLMTGAAAYDPRKAMPGEATQSTWKTGQEAAEAAKALKKPLDKSPTAFPAPSAADLPSLPTAGPAAGAAPRQGGQAAIAAPAAAPAPRRPDPLPAGVNAAAEGVSILDVFRKDKSVILISRADDLYAERSAQLALEYTQDGKGRGWINPETGTTGTFTPTRTFQLADGAYCREYAHEVQLRQKVGGDVKSQVQATGRFACRQQTGRWKFLP